MRRLPRSRPDDTRWVWRCVICGQQGIGNGWANHYDTNHDTSKGRHEQAHNYGHRQPDQRP